MTAALELLRQPRFVLFAAVCAYVAAYLVAYALLLAPLFGYFGLGFVRPVDPVRVLLPLAFALVPVAWLPLRMDRPSNFLFWIQYYIVYIPGCFLAFLSTRPDLPLWRSMALAATLAAGLAILLLAQRRLPLLVLPRLAPSRLLFWGCFLAAAVALTALVVIVLGANFRLASIADIYEVRRSGSDRVGGNVIVLYAMNWLNALVLPFLMAYALFARRRGLLVLVGGFYLFLFGIWGGKASLLAPAFIGLIYLLVRQSPERVPIVLPLGLAAIVLSPFAIPPFDDLWRLAREWGVQIVPQRTFSSSALLIVQYLEFFTLNPLTYGSHVGVVGGVLGNPYGWDIPRTIGMYQYGGPMTANANFWATDGIAGFGLLGVPLVSVVCALVFWLLDSATRHVRPAFTVVAMGYIGTNFADTGLFTTMLTGGLLLLVVLLLFVPRDFRFLSSATGR